MAITTIYKGLLTPYMNIAYDEVFINNIIDI